MSHWDVDGIASAAIALRRGARLVKLSALSALPKILEDAVLAAEREGLDTVIVADLNPSPWQRTLIETSVDYAESAGIRIVWLDHHEWDPEVKRELGELGVELHLDTGRVTAELMAEYLRCDDPVCKRLAIMARDDDLFLNNDRLAVKWRRILRWYGWKVRYSAVRDWARGILWPAWVQPLWEQLSIEYDTLMEETLRNTRLFEVNGLKVLTVQAVSDKLHPGEIHSLITSRGLHADIYAIIYENGVSLRSEHIPLACIARHLGGGGHEHAAGIPGSDWTPEKLATALKEAISHCLKDGIMLKVNTPNPVLRGGAKPAPRYPR